MPVWQQLAWTNNKGKTAGQAHRRQGLRLHAKRPLGGSPFRAVDPGGHRPELEQVKYEATDTLRLGRLRSRRRRYRQY